MIYLYDVDIEESESCEEDSLSIYDGKDASAVLIDRICGQMVYREYVASGNTLFIQLKANYAVSKRGFYAYFTYCHNNNNCKSLSFSFHNVDYLFVSIILLLV